MTTNHECSYDVKKGKFWTETKFLDIMARKPKIQLLYELYEVYNSH